MNLKHAAYYLPYSLRMAIPVHYQFDGMRTDAQSLVMQGVKETPLPYIKLIGVSGFYPADDFKPILRPMSDFKKDVGHDHQTVNIWEIVFKEWRARKSKTCKTLTNTPDNRRVFGHWLGNINDIQIKPVWMLRILLKYHFDVFGLIKIGDAVNINTITEKV